jgi:hypothetical protein
VGLARGFVPCQLRPQKCLRRLWIGNRGAPGRIGEGLEVFELGPSPLDDALAEVLVVVDEEQERGARRPFLPLNSSGVIGRNSSNVEIARYCSTEMAAFSRSPIARLPT